MLGWLTAIYLAVAVLVSAVLLIRYGRTLDLTDLEVRE